MDKCVQELTISNISVRANIFLTIEVITKLVKEVAQAWAWEGRSLDKVELICQGQWVHICSYEKPYSQQTSWRVKNNEFAYSWS